MATTTSTTATLIVILITEDTILTAEDTQASTNLDHTQASTDLDPTMDITTMDITTITTIDLLIVILSARTQTFDGPESTKSDYKMPTITHGTICYLFIQLGIYL